MKTQKSTSYLRQDLSWLKRSQVSYFKRDLFFAFCMACIFMSLVTIAFS